MTGVISSCGFVISGLVTPHGHTVIVFTELPLSSQFMAMPVLYRILQATMCLYIYRVSRIRMRTSMFRKLPSRANCVTTSAGTKVSSLSTQFSLQDINAMQPLTCAQNNCI